MEPDFAPGLQHGVDERCQVHWYWYTIHQLPLWFQPLLFDTDIYLSSKTRFVVWIEYVSFDHRQLLWQFRVIFLIRACYCGPGNHPISSYSIFPIHSYHQQAAATGFRPSLVGDSDVDNWKNVAGVSQQVRHTGAYSASNNRQDTRTQNKEVVHGISRKVGLLFQ